MTRAWLRPQAEQDLVERTRYDRAHADDSMAQRFFDAALGALRAAERAPNAGSPRVGALADVPGLRAWRVKGFPARWYYFVLDDRLDVVRLLSDRQDLVALLTNADDE